MTITTKENANGRIITYVTISVDSSDLDDLEEEYFGEIYNELEEITEGKNFRCNAENGICACVKAGHQVEAVEQLFDSYDLNHHSVVFTREKIADESKKELATVNIETKTQNIVEEKKALSDALAAKWGKDWAINRTKAVESMFSNDAAEEVDAIMAEISAATHRMNIKTIKKQIADTVKEVAFYIRDINYNVWDYLRGNPNNDVDEEGMNKRGESLIENLTKLADLKAQLLKLAPYEVFNEEIAIKAEIEATEAAIQEQAANSMKCGEEIPAVIPTEKGDTADELIDEPNLEYLESEIVRLQKEKWILANERHSVCLDYMKIKENGAPQFAVNYLAAELRDFDLRMLKLSRCQNELKEQLSSAEREKQVGDDVLTYRGEKCVCVKSLKYGGLMELGVDGEWYYYTMPIKLSGKGYDNDFDPWCFEDFMLILSERGAVIFDDKKSAVVDDTDDELIDEPEESISHKANQAVEDELCKINGKKVSVAEYVQFCKDIIAENEPIRAEAWFEMKKALAADACEEHDAWLDDYAEAGFAIRQCVSDIEKLTGEIVPVDESYLEYEEQIADSDSANLGDSKAKPKSDDFTSKLAELEAEKAVAKAKADEAKTAYNAASDAYEDKRIALQDFKPKVETESAKHQDSLARAMKIALDNIQRCCREHNFKAACQEMTLYNICSNALRDLRNVA